MKNSVKLLLAGGAILAGVKIFSTVNNLKDAQDQVSVIPEGISNIDFASGNPTFNVNLRVVNSSDQNFKVRVVSAKILNGSTQVGYMLPGSPLTTLPAQNEVVLPGVVFKLQLDQLSNTKDPFGNLRYEAYLDVSGVQVKTTGQIV